MAGSILKEVTFTPNVFDKTFTFGLRKRYSKLISILESLIDSGIIIAPSYQWKDQVYTFIEQYDDEDKDDLIALLEEIDSRSRIVAQHGFINNKKEKNWIRTIEELNMKRAFDFAAATEKTMVTETIEHIDRSKYKNTGAKVDKQTFDYMKKMLIPILSYAEIVKIIDPYFNLKKERFSQTLEIICENAGENRGNKNNIIIDIHTSVKAMLNRDKEFDWFVADSWQKIIQNYEKQYGHSISLYIWEERKERYGWHERWIITNQCGIFIGKGSDISDWTDSTWGLLDWEELPEISNKFDRNRQIYNHIGYISSVQIEKVGRPATVSMYLTEEERIEKRNRSPKKLKKRLTPKTFGEKDLNG